MTLSDPVAERPHAPGYEVREGPDGLLPFSWARERLAVARTWWVASVRPDGRPHVMPIWGAWVDDRAYLLGQLTARWGRNLQRNPACVVHIEQGDDVVIIEGDARLVTAPDQRLLDGLKAAFARYAATPDAVVEPAAWIGKGFWEVVPHTVFGFSDYVTDATRWRFPVPEAAAEGG
jgi:hypothetical protein